MNASTKAALVIGGYAAACLCAVVVVAIHVALTSGPAAQASSGMYAFGDALLFLAVFGVAAVPPTAAALYWLRPYRPFWIAFSAAGVAISATALVALVLYVAGRSAPQGSANYDCSAPAVLRIFAAPLFALAFLLAGILAPNRSARLTLLGCMFVEAFAIGVVALFWITSMV
jgi:hypothetical protein